MAVEGYDVALVDVGNVDEVLCVVHISSIHTNALSSNIARQGISAYLSVFLDDVLHHVVVSVHGDYLVCHGRIVFGSDCVEDVFVCESDVCHVHDGLGECGR